MNRGKNKKKGARIPFEFAPLPRDISKAVMAELSATELRVWLALCLQCMEWSNGTGKLCRSVIKEYSLGSQRDVSAATKKLIASERIIRTRTSRQRTCALYGVTHLPLNLDALAKAGFTDAEIRSVQARYAGIACDTNSGSANGAARVEAPNSRIDISGSAKPLEQPLALPPGNRIGPISTALALPPWNTSKNLPSVDGNPGAA